MTTTYPYLGTVGAMQQLPGPNGQIVETQSRAETLHTLLSGGVAKTQRPTTKRSWQLPYVNRPAVGLDHLLTGFYEGVFDVLGTDFTFVHPMRDNVLPLDVSQFGLRAGSSMGWAASSGTLTADTAATPPPAGIAPTAVAKWAGASASATLQPGVTANTAIPASHPVVLTPEATTVALYVMASAPASFTLAAAGHTSSGANDTSLALASISVTTAWQRFSVTAAAGAATATSVLVLPRLVMPAVSPPASVWVCAAHLGYGTTLAPFTRGYGSPRVTLGAAPGDTRDKWDGYSDHTLTLMEV